jgi:hypothetical protein
VILFIILYCYWNRPKMAVQTTTSQPSE